MNWPGDASLVKRPMDRVVKPLSQMGAHAQWPPLRVGGKLPLHGIEYQPPVPSAQVKSALLLAGLFAEGTTTVIEPVATRNHTEVMLRTMGVDVRSEGDRVEVDKATLPAGCALDKHPTYKAEFVPGHPVFADRVTCRLP